MARRKGGLYLPLDVGFPDDDRVLEVGEKPGWLYLHMMLAAKRLGTDGVLSVRQIERLHINGWKQRLDELLRVELVVPYDEGEYLVAGWLKHNDRQVEVEDRRRKDAERKRSRNPHGIRTDSEPGRDVERSREKRSTSDAPELRAVPAVDNCGFHLLPLPCRGCAADQKAETA